MNHRKLDGFTSNKQHLKQEVKQPLSSLVKTREGLKWVTLFCGSCISSCQPAYSSRSQTASPPLDKILTLGIENKFSLLSLNRIFRGDGRGVRKWQPKLFWKLPTPLSPPKVGRTSLSASWESSKGIANILYLLVINFLAGKQTASLL